MTAAYAGAAVELVAPILLVTGPGAAWVRERLGPQYLSAARVYLGVALLGPLLGVHSSTWLPWEAAAGFAGPLACAAGVLLVAGIGSRYVAAVIACAGSAGAMMDPRFTDDSYILAILAILTVHGAGRWSLDALFDARWRTRFPQLDGRPAFALDDLPRVVIVGAGFGGVSCAAALRRVRVSVTLIDRANHHLFQPLLYQVATAAVSPGDIAAPVRPLFRDAFNTRVLLGAVTAVDTAGRSVLMDGRRIPYDYLVLATGARHSYFGKDAWAAHAPGLKRIEDATEIRRRLLTAFERAEASDDEEERRALLTFLVVGGGPTGVELAGAIAELARFGMDKEFRRFDPATARVILVQSGPRVLPAFDAKLSAVAARSLAKLGVEVLLDSRVEHIDAAGVAVSGRRIEARTVLWAAGVKASPAAQWLNAAGDGAGRVVVGADLTVAGQRDVFVIGDTAASSGWKGQPVPGLAPAAKQGGRHAARVIRARVEDRPPPGDFVYRHRGNLATIGRQSAVIDFGFCKLWGAPAWWIWGLVHVGLLVGARNRATTVVNWFWTYLTFSGGIRLITGGGERAAE